MPDDFHSSNSRQCFERLKFNTCHLWFILDFLLPAIGHEMERREIFEISSKEIVRIIEPILKGWQPLPDGAVPTEHGGTYDAFIMLKIKSFSLVFL
jgi:hypothetical protein